MEESDCVKTVLRSGVMPDAGKIAAAVSGGPDSMAMLWLLSRWAVAQGVEIFAYTVDHGLRAGSADEAAQVGAWVRGWPRVTHDILKWDGEKPGARVLEEARAARYALIEAAMEKNGIRHLFVAHHADDQAETFLTRLAKGSGVDGLGAMRGAQERSGITILRPLLEVPKAELVALCEAESIPFVRDPTNENMAYLRPRLRQAREVLEREGLSLKRLTSAARRCARAADALDAYAGSLEKSAGREEGDGTVYDLSLLLAAPEEMMIRVLSRRIEASRAIKAADYPVRLERLEALCDRIRHDARFRGATLGGCKLSIRDRKGGRILKVEKE